MTVFVRVFCTIQRVVVQMDQLQVTSPNILFESCEIATNNRHDMQNMWEFLDEYMAAVVHHMLVRLLERAHA